MKNIGHNRDINEKYCREGADEYRHDNSLPWDHPDQHNSHEGGCICIHGNEYLQKGEWR